MSLLCCAAFAGGAELGERLRGPAPAEVPARGAVCHFCHLLPSLCRQQRLGSPEGRTAPGGGAPSGEGAGPPGQAPRSWVSTCGGLGQAEGAFLPPWPELIATALPNSPSEEPSRRSAGLPGPTCQGLCGSV